MRQERFLDLLRRRLVPAVNHQNVRETRQVLCDPSIVSFSIDNVAEYFFRNMVAAELNEILREWHLEDFPVLLPPFERSFFEYVIPPRLREHNQHRVHSRIRPDLRNYFPTYAGAFVNRFRADDVKAFNPLLPFPAETAWVVAFVTFALVDYQAVGPMCRWLFFLDASGHHLPLDAEGGQWIPLEVNGLGVSFTLGTQEATEVSLGNIFSVAYPIFLAISFLHCKNVTRHEHTPNKKLSAQHRRLSGHPLVTYYTLEIEPMKQVLRAEGQSETVGLKKSLHICRGHFADYTGGKGLFGKYHGQFWIPQHVRGSAEQGIVGKDYAVKAPRGETP